GKQTSPAVIATSMGLAKTLGKVGVLVGNCRGFAGNRMFHPYQREAQFLLEEAATAAQGDAALSDFGIARGAVPAGGRAGPGSGGGGAAAGSTATWNPPASASRSWRTGCVRWAATARRPARAGIATPRAAGRPSPIPR